MKMSIEQIGKEASESAKECFAAAERTWNNAMNVSTFETDRTILAFRALALGISACTSVICSTLAKIEHAKTESDEDLS